MKTQSGLCISVMVALCGGCGGDGGSQEAAGIVPPPWIEVGTNPNPAAPANPAPVSLPASCAAGQAEGQPDGGRIGNIWMQRGHAEWVGAGHRLLIAETGEFRRIPAEAWRDQTFGKFQEFGTWEGGKRYEISNNVFDVGVSGPTWLETNYYPATARAWLEDDGSLTFDVETQLSDWGSFPLYEMSFAGCNGVYERGSSFAMLAGTYVDGLTTLAVDDQGMIFYQHDSCIGQGSAELIDSEFNMYRIKIEVESCSGGTVHAPGVTFSGLAYLDDSGNGFLNDVLEFALSAGGAESERIQIWSQSVKK